MDDFLKRAVELSKQNVDEGGHPFGAVLVKDGEIVSEGVNELHIHYDASSHAEMLAVRRAQEKLETHDLSGCTMYASGEPCPMCYTVMQFAGMQDVYFAETVEEAYDVGLTKGKEIYEELKKPKEERVFQMKYRPLEGESSMERFRKRNS
ncbi:nucleoside deaminase [Salimicrobium halophilum]|uniref:tRNA(Arg) A34 adenosine deaminase TadA n=1 Tax=Salimicrobium halophilum TaxID=86666 RepID=A0A1G8R1V9_9BACI|nr:nucleoside deaminase [Salimicrobium halophilum]SDJ10969.1 tRNA(Arg) A34 adenosine deaminase TadA [Salimicrobium halophilum]